MTEQHTSGETAQIIDLTAARRERVRKKVLEWLSPIEQGERERLADRATEWLLS